MPAVSSTELSTLIASHDIIAIGMLADDVRRRLHGLETTFVRVADVDVTPGTPVNCPPGAGEVRIKGRPATRVAALARIEAVRAETGSVPLSAFSLADLEEVAASENMTLRALLEDMHAAGLELIAEAPFERLRDPRRSIEEVNIAGLALARLTIHQLPSAEPDVLLREVAALQQAVAVVRAFAPLPRRVNPAVPSTGYDDVKRLALARVIVDNVPSIQVDWSLYGPKLAQVALTVGADDVDAVSPIDDMAEGSRRAPLEEIRRNIAAASLQPLERNGRFEPLAR